MSAPVVVATQALIVVSPEDGTSRSSSEYNPHVAGLANGQFVAIWDDFLPQSNPPANYPYALDPDGQVSTMVRLFDASGAGVDPAAPASSDLSGNFGGGASVITLGNGNIAVMWNANNFTAQTSRVGAQIYDGRTGAPIGAEITIPGDSALDIMSYGLVALPEGAAGVVYLDRVGSYTELRMRTMNADGSAGTDTLLKLRPQLPASGPTDQLVALTGSNAGVIAVLTRASVGNTLGVMFLRSDGTEALPAVDLGSFPGTDLSIEALADGGAAIAYIQSGLGGGPTVVRVLRVNADGTLSGDDPLDISFPGEAFGVIDLLALSDGGLLVAGNTYNGSRGQIQIQRVKADGTLDGNAVVLADANKSFTRPELTLSGDGTVIVVYESGDRVFGDAIAATRLDLGLSANMVGTATADRLSGYSGKDTISGGGGSDTLSGGAGNDVLLGGAARDILDGGAGNDRLDGGIFNDVLNGGIGQDTLIGGTGNDLLRGGTGLDRLIGGQGQDTLIGGTGADVFVFTKADIGSQDLISGWDTGDRIDFDGLGPVSFLGSNPFTGGTGAAVRAYTTSNQTFIEVDTGDADAIANFVIRIDSVVTLSASDFILS